MNINMDSIYKANMPWWKNDIYGPELMGMRLLRKKSIKDMQKIVGNDFDIKYYESEQDYPAPPPLCGIYMTYLNCNMHHVHQFREILNGKKKDFNDSRAINKRLRDKVYKKYNNQCSVCESKERLEIHHIKEYSKGGRTELENLKLLCVDCHAEEHKGTSSYSLIKSKSKR